MQLHLAESRFELTNAGSGSRKIKLENNKVTSTIVNKVLSERTYLSPRQDEVMMPLSFNPSLKLIRPTNPSSLPSSGPGQEPVVW